MAAPLHPRDLRARAYDISGKHPGRNWHRRYLKRYKKTIKMAKPRHLDPKRAQNFNRTNVEGYLPTSAKMTLLRLLTRSRYQWRVQL
ncbi:hypothetical protein PAXRUDRAFT_832425 [Paxillus rubicundulus Ve08.2h10]|uniref:Unplaced genomic scaffold scaffold_863, whole genome shotgun sequence n=1 Tax=Paxillus rubicundulus Ve08.2h10 TaxID=930991 RepID=A0A0D0DR63_9AGAM|nr:hypothetical protein PAXRUDRAFT_832425 [Paxillus rubicundulus Ve08.2h10]